MSTLRRPIPPPGTESEIPVTAPASLVSPMAPPLAPTLPTGSTVPVLVDTSGRRQRRVRLIARVVVVCLLGYLILAGVLLLVRPGLVPLALPRRGTNTHQHPHRPVHRKAPGAPDAANAPAAKATTSPPGPIAQPVPRSGFSSAAPVTPDPRATAARASAGHRSHGHSTGTSGKSGREPTRTHHVPPGQAKKPTDKAQSTSSAKAHGHHKAAS
jgi:hypothetical protein